MSSGDATLQLDFKPQSRISRSAFAPDREGVPDAIGKGCKVVLLSFYLRKNLGSLMLRSLPIGNGFPITSGEVTNITFEEVFEQLSSLPIERTCSRSGDFHPDCFLLSPILGDVV